MKINKTLITLLSIITFKLSLISSNTTYPVLKQNGNSQINKWSSKLAKKTDCFDCSQQQNRKFCQIPTGEWSKNYQGHCCLKDDFSFKCTPQENSQCSKPYEESKLEFYSYCAQSQSPILCSNNQSSLQFLAKSSPQYFSFDQLQRSQYNGLSDGQYSVCTYQIRIPDFKYTFANLIIRFNVIKNVNVHLSSGNSLRNITEIIIPENSSAVINQNYSIKLEDLRKLLLVTVIPDAGQNQTNFEFMYWVNGQETNTLIYLYNNVFGERDQGIFISVGILTIFFLIFMIILLTNASATKSNQNKKSQIQNNSRQATQSSENSKIQIVQTLDSQRSEFERDSNSDFENLDQIVRGDIQIFQKEGVTQEQIVMLDFQKKLWDIHRMTPEEFYRICDKGYKQKISCEDFKNYISQHQLGLTKNYVNRLLNIFDEGKTGIISIFEYYNALDTYECRGEDGYPFKKDMPFWKKSVFKFIIVLNDRNINMQEIFRLNDPQNTRSIRIQQLKESLQNLNEFSEKELVNIGKYFDQEKNSWIGESQFYHLVHKLQKMHIEQTIY